MSENTAGTHRGTLILNQSLRTAHVLVLTVVIFGCAEDAEDTLALDFSDVFSQDSDVHLVTAATDPLGRSEGLAFWNGNLAVSDPLASNVKVFNTDGTLRATIGRLGGGPGEFIEPNSIVVDDRGFLAVLDRPTGTISFFDPDGTFEEAFRFPGAFTGGMVDAFHGTRLLVGTWLVEEEEIASDHVVHLFDLAGNIESSFGQRPVARTREESAFMGMQLTVADDSLGAWGTVGRRTIYVQPLDRKADGEAVMDSVHFNSFVPIDWDNAPYDDMELFEWVTDYELLTGILAGPGILVARFQGGDARRGEQWYRYGFISLEERRVLAVTDRTTSLIQHIEGDTAYGIRIEDDGEAYLSRYRLNPGLLALR